MPAIQNYCRHILSSLSRIFSKRSMPSKELNVDTNLTSVLICGLGNLDRPETRHSVGMKAMDHLAVKLAIPWIKRSDLKSYVAVRTLEIGDVTIPKKNGVSSRGDGVNTGEELISMINLVLLKPTIPMNLNGKSVLRAAKFFNTNPENIFLVHDEMEQPVGKFKIKEGGSARGHNGVKSVAECFQTNTMSRLLIGIDRPLDRREIIEYVLQRWEEEEQRTIERQMDDSMKLLLTRVEKNFGKRFQGQLVGVLC